MKALVYHGPEDLRYEEVPVPRYSDDEVLVKIMAVGICGSDVHGYLGKTGRRTPPMIMGHEMSGIIVEKGKNVKNFEVGDRVAVFPYVTCNQCSYCQNGLFNCCENKKFFGVFSNSGGMAEYLNVPEALLLKMPDGVSYEIAAMIEPLSVSYSGVKKGDINKEKNVVIIGAGPIGLMCLMISKKLNPKSITVIDLSQNRLELARKLGANNVINPNFEDASEKVKSLFGDEGAHVVIEAVGIEPTIRQAVSIAAAKGKVVLIGMSQKMVNMDVFEIICKEIDVIGSFLYTIEEYKEILNNLAEYEESLKECISLKADLSEGVKIFRELAESSDKIIKAILTS